MWGTQNAGQHDDGRRGLIPTGVGNTPWIWVRPLLVRAHPHGCGEHVGGLQINAAEAGSSPRVWGTLAQIRATFPGSGLIPTGVGNTGVEIPTVDHVEAHPHGCGEHVGGLQINAAEAGSSPRVWGTQVHGKGGKVRLGLIPTGVGNTVQGR